jgi:hypothetical protein
MASCRADIVERSVKLPLRRLVGCKLHMGDLRDKQCKGGSDGGDPDDSRP